MCIAVLTSPWRQVHNVRKVPRPYSGLETQAPDLLSKGEGAFSAPAGTLQHPL
jgi:hypothetical protein